MASKTSTDKGSERARGITNPLSKRLFDLKEAAQYLGRSTWGVRELVWKGRLPAIRDGRKLYIDLFDMHEYIERNRVSME